MDSSTNAFTRKFEIAMADPDRFLKTLEQAIYTTAGDGVCYDAGIRGQAWDAPVDREFLGLFPDCALEYWIYPDKPNVAWIRVIVNEDDYEEEVVTLPDKHLWQTNKPIISLRIPAQKYIYHLSLCPHIDTFGPSQVVGRIMYRVLQRDIDAQDRYTGIAKVWTKLQAFDAIEFNLNLKMASIEVVSRCDTRFEPFHNMLLNRIGATNGQLQVGENGDEPLSTDPPAQPPKPQRKRPGRKVTPLYVDAYQRIYERDEDRAAVINELLTDWIQDQCIQGVNPDAASIETEQKRIASGIDYQLKKRRQWARQ